MPIHSFYYVHAIGRKLCKEYWDSLTLKWEYDIIIHIKPT